MRKIRLNKISKHVLDTIFKSYTFELRIYQKFNEERYL